MGRTVQELISAIKKDERITYRFRKILSSEKFIYFKHDEHISIQEECLHIEKSGIYRGGKQKNKAVFNILEEGIADLGITEDNKLVYNANELRLIKIDSLNIFLTTIKKIDNEQSITDNTIRKELRLLVNSLVGEDIEEVKNTINPMLNNNGDVKKTIADITSILNEKKDHFEVKDYECDLRRLKCLKDTMIHEQDFKFFYRGQPCFGYEAIPPVYRDEKLRLINKEDEDYLELTAKYPKEFAECQCTFEKLSLMQHYGMSTRLLDLTDNPLIALYFACSGDKNENEAGEVLIFLGKHYERNVYRTESSVYKDVSCYPFRIKYFSSDTVSVIANLARMPANLNIIRKIAEGEKRYKNEQLLNFIRDEKPYFLDKMLLSDITDIVIVIPKNNSVRLNAQGGAFLLFGIGDNKKRPAQIKNSFVDSDNKQVKLYIPASNKKKILNELERLGIHKGTVFPELETYAKYLKEKRTGGAP